MSKLPPAFQVYEEVARALEYKAPIVALESTVITHGLPYPENLTLAEDMENEVRSQGVTPATIAVLEGRIQVGLHMTQLRYLATNTEVMKKISKRDFASAIAKMSSGGTTVAGTMLAAHTAGIRVFATGGIGGVHYELSKSRRGAFDISTDLPTLAHIPMIVVCAGAKAILDLQSTLEYLETWGVPVVGYKTDDFPAFYTLRSGFKTSARVDSAEEAVHFAKVHWSLGLKSAVLIVAPPPVDVALPSDEVKDAVLRALKEAQVRGIKGQEVTPFLLKRVVDFTGGARLRDNLGLLLNNAFIASQIAREWAKSERT
jgi:pseudouridine-5'-phosphate glycosidase